MANVYEARIDTRDVMEMNFTPVEFERFRLKPGDILLNEGQSKELVGRPAIYRGEVPGACFQNTLVRFQANVGTSPEFALAVFLEYLHSGRFQNICKWTTNIAHLGAERFASMPFPLPPLAEQRRIVAKLEALQARSRRAREALEAVPPLLEKLRQSILAAAFRGDLTADWREKHPDVEPASELLKRIRVERRKKWEEAELVKLKAKGKPPTDDRWKQKYVEPESVDDSDLPELPEGWGWATWREVGFCQNGRSFPSAEYSDAGIKLLRPGNLHVSGELVWNDQNTRCMPSRWAAEYPDFIVRGNELVINLTAQSLKDEFLGRVCLTLAGEECLLNQRIGRLSPVGIPAKYWLWYFKSPEFRRFVDTLNTGSLIQHMFTSQIDDCPVPVMPLEEAKVLVSIVERHIGALQHVLAETEDRLSMLPSLESTILSKAFRGELVPQDPSDVLASHPSSQTTSAVAASPQPKRARNGATRPRQ